MTAKKKAAKTAAKKKAKAKKKNEYSVTLTKEQEELASKLTKLQRETVINVECHGMSQVKAYNLAGGKSQGKHAEVAASKLLSLPKVKEFRGSFARESLRKGIMSREEAMERLSIHARIKITDICTFKLVEIETAEGDTVMNTVWEMKNAEDIDPDVAACIKSVTFTKTGPKIELYDANGSIKLLADMQGWNAAQKYDHTSSDGSMSPKGKSLDDFYSEVEQSSQE